MPLNKLAQMQILGEPGGKSKSDAAPAAAAPAEGRGEAASAGAARQGPPAANCRAPARSRVSVKRSEITFPKISVSFPSVNECVCARRAAWVLLLVDPTPFFPRFE